MSQPFIAEMRIMPFGFAPRGWARCDGQLMGTNQNQALFAILGTSFGGNGVSTFQLPDLRGRVPLGSGKTYHLGQSGGEQTHMLTPGEVPSHTHAVQGIAVAGTLKIPTANVLAAVSSGLYAKPSAKMVALPPATISNVGGTPHPNLQPYQVVTMAIALNGIYPSRN
jgi:microcystin-dependent protein